MRKRCETLGFYTDNEGSIDLRNIGILPQYYTASQPRRPRLESPPPWKPQNSHQVVNIYVTDMSLPEY